jgi:prevent-host-death family protein
MGEVVAVDWQVQEAKQRFSELLRRAHDEGPQVITRHGEEVAVMVDIQWYREKTIDGGDIAVFLQEMPRLPEFAEALDTIIAEREEDHDRPLPDLSPDASGSPTGTASER